MAWPGLMGCGMAARPWCQGERFSMDRGGRVSPLVLIPPASWWPCAFIRCLLPLKIQAQAPPLASASVLRPRLLLVGPADGGCLRLVMTCNLDAHCRHTFARAAGWAIARSQADLAMDFACLWSLESFLDLGVSNVTTGGGNCHLALFAAGQWAGSTFRPRIGSGGSGGVSH